MKKSFTFFKDYSVFLRFKIWFASIFFQKVIYFTDGYILLKKYYYRENVSLRNVLIRHLNKFFDRRILFLRRKMFLGNNPFFRETIRLINLRTSVFMMDSNYHFSWIFRISKGNFPSVNKLEFKCFFSKC